MSKKIDTNDLDKIFDNLVLEDKLTINTIEELMLEELEDYKKELRLHIEELLANKVDEKKLIAKKNKNGKKKGSN